MLGIEAYESRWLTTAERHLNCLQNSLLGLRSHTTKFGASQWSPNTRVAGHFRFMRRPRDIPTALTLISLLALCRLCQSEASYRIGLEREVFSLYFLHSMTLKRSRSMGHRKTKPFLLDRNSLTSIMSYSSTTKNKTDLFSKSWPPSVLPGMPLSEFGSDDLLWNHVRRLERGMRQGSIQEWPLKQVAGRRLGLAKEQAFLSGLYIGRFRLELRQLIIIILA